MTEFPTQRLRRLRTGQRLRRLVTETRLSVDDLIYPLFVSEEATDPEPIENMADQKRWPVDQVSKEIERAAELGINAFLIFGVPAERDEKGTSAYAADGVVQRALRKIREETEEVTLVTDVCLCQYTSHGHCGIVKRGEIVNDETLDLLRQVAVTHADSGADIVAPSAMMDGQVAALRRALDGSGHEGVGILAYSAKFASNFYSPFRHAAESAPSFGDRSSYQINPPNSREALREMQEDLEEGADVLMVKPALPYLDVLSEARSAFKVPLAAYQVSGEYHMINATTLDSPEARRALAVECLTSIKRAGADVIITYFAKDLARWMRE